MENVLKISSMNNVLNYLYLCEGLEVFLLRVKVACKTLNMVLCLDPLDFKLFYQCLYWWLSGLSNPQLIIEIIHSLQLFVCLDEIVWME